MGSVYQARNWSSQKPTAKMNHEYRKYFYTDDPKVKCHRKKTCTKL